MRGDIDKEPSIIDRLVKSFPDDMPDLRAETNHLAPLTLPAQISMFYPESKHRLGFEVCKIPPRVLSLKE